jgi:osmotically-inducible protein OsmY
LAHPDEGGDDVWRRQDEPLTCCDCEKNRATACLTFVAFERENTAPDGGPKSLEQALNDHWDGSSSIKMWLCLPGKRQWRDTMSDRDRQDSNERGQFGSGYRGSDNQASQWQTQGDRQQGGEWQQDDRQRGASSQDARDYRFSGQGHAYGESQGSGRSGSQHYGPDQGQRGSSGGYRSQLNHDDLRNDQRDASRNYQQSRGSYGQHNDRGQQDWQRNDTQGRYQQRSDTSGYRVGNFDASGGNDFGNFTSEDFGGRDFSNRSGGAVGGGMRSSESYKPSYGLSSWFNNDDDNRGGSQGRSGPGAGHEDYGNWRQYGESRGFLARAGDEVASWFGDEDASRRREQDHRQGNEGQTQSHRGRGPSNYTRSDERIREDANDHLTHDHHVDASHISVSVKDGELTLDGTVESRAEKRRAEDAVEHISGVKHVQNNLRVQDRSSASSSGGGSYGSSAAGSPSYGQGSGQASSTTSGSGTAGQIGSSGASTSAATGSTTSSGTSGTPGSDTISPGQTGASTTSGIGSTAAAGIGSASTSRSSDKTS